ncbi:hypothetical protein [Nostoc sp.]|uniref:hypothetical protein n=1 Tax=Nostoc sp. TaxID=1180 RepID=UPI002FF4D545
MVRIAEATHQPVEALVTQSAISNLPPFTENAPTDIQPELLRMQIVDKDELTIQNSKFKKFQTGI